MIDPLNRVLEQYVLPGEPHLPPALYVEDDPIRSEHMLCVHFTMNALMGMLPPDVPFWTGGGQRRQCPRFPGSSGSTRSGVGRDNWEYKPIEVFGYNEFIGSIACQGGNQNFH